MSDEQEAKPKTRRARAVSAMPRSEGVPGFPVSMPTCGNDLIGLWSLPMEAITQAKLKIGRGVPMSQKVEIVSECTVQEYSMESIAASYGPGEYRLVLNPGPMGAWGGKTAVVQVSKDYARECGFDPMPIAPPPAPRFSQLRSIQESSRAIVEGQGFTPAMMGQFVETIVERVVDRVRPQSTPVDPVQQMMTMLTVVQGLQKSALDQALAVAGMANPLEKEEKGESWMDLAKALAPSIGSIAAAIVNRGPVVQDYPPQNALPPGPTAHPIHVTHAQAAPENQGVTMPHGLTEDDLKPYAGAIAMLRPFGALVAMKVNGNPGGESVAQELSEYIPERLWESMIGFAELVKARGTSILGVIHPAIANEKGAACIARIGSILQAEIQGESHD